MCASPLATSLTGGLGPHRFEEFFETPALAAAAPEAVGFDGFFKGAFSYHYHNSWYVPLHDLFAHSCF